LCCSVYRPPLPPSPTRRSSDLSAVPLAALSALDTSGTSPAELGEMSGWAYLVSSAYAPGASIVHVLGALAVFLNTQFSRRGEWRSEEHTSELQSRFDLVCRLLL